MALFFIPDTVLQPLFKTLSKLWFGIQEEAELLKVLNNIRLNLQAFNTSQAKLFPAAYLDSLLGASEVKTDEQRMMESSGIDMECQFAGSPYFF